MGVADRCQGTRRGRAWGCRWPAVAALALIGGAVALTAVPLPAAAEPVTVEPVQLPSFADLAEKVAPAVLTLRVRTAAPQQAAVADDGSQATPGPIPPQGQRGGRSLGSGFFISGDGYLVTNNHVVDGGTSFTAITADGTEYRAMLVGKDDRTDLALLKIDADAPFTYVKWADEPPRVGDWVLAIGNPFGVGHTVTLGIVSARGRNIGSGPYDDYLQIDAPINRGNSGGPTFNIRGEVVGINTSIFSPSGGSVGIAFDIPAATAVGIVAKLKEFGAVVRGWLGVRTQPLTAALADSLKLAGTEGAVVAEPVVGSPAAMAGIMMGDVILSVDGVAVVDPRDLSVKIGAAAPATTVELTVWRDGARREIAVVLGTLPPANQPVQLQRPGGNPPDSGNGGGGNGDGSGRAPSNQDELKALPDLGLTLAAAGETDGGIAVKAVVPDGAADQSGLWDGDVILSVGGAAVSSAADLGAAVETAGRAGARALLLRVRTGDIVRYVGVPLT
jgi:serine protease Do